MPGIQSSAQVAASARIDPSASIGEGCVIEDDVIVGPRCSIGPRTRLRSRAIVVQDTTLGEANDVHPYAVLGGDPQDRSFKPEQPGEAHIGDRNIFREGATVSRGNWNGPATRIGSDGYFMCQAHIGHNAGVGDRVVMANGACLAGHSKVGNGCVLSAFAMVHQFVTVGDMVMFRGGAGVSMNVPPFLIVFGVNQVGGLNRVGLRRNPAFNPTDRDEVKRVFRAIYRERGGQPIESVLTELEPLPWGPAARAFIEFVRWALNAPAPRARGLVGGQRVVSARRVSLGEVEES